MSHLVETRPEVSCAGQFSQTTSALWKLTEDNGEDSFIAQRVYNASSEEPVSLTVLPFPGDTPAVGDYGIVITRGDGEWLFFRRGTRLKTCTRFRSLPLQGTGYLYMEKGLNWHMWTAPKTRNNRSAAIFRLDCAEKVDSSRIMVILPGLESAWQCEVDVACEAEIMDYRLEFRIYALLEEFDLDTLSATAYGELSKRQGQSFRIDLVKPETPLYSCLGINQIWWRKSILPVQIDFEDDAQVYGFAVEADEPADLPGDCWAVIMRPNAFEGGIKYHTVLKT